MVLNGIAAEFCLTVRFYAAELFVLKNMHAGRLSHVNCIIKFEGFKTKSRV